MAVRSLSFVAMSSLLSIIIILILLLLFSWLFFPLPGHSVLGWLGLSDAEDLLDRVVIAFLQRDVVAAGVKLITRFSTLKKKTIEKRK